jgi:uncharacterized membrane protein
MLRLLRRLVPLVVLLFALFASIAQAQSTGGSFGGGDWGGSSSGSSGGGGSYGGSGGYYSGVSSTPDPNAYEPPFGVQCLIAFVFLGGLYWLLFWRGGIFARLGAGGAKIDVSMVQLSIDARSRRFVQARLAELAAKGDARTAEGRVALLRATVQALEGAKLAWVHAGVRNFAPMPVAQAQAEHTRLANDARSGFQHELVRNAGGATTTQTAPEMQPREHEGQGVVLVSVIVASRSPLKDPSAASPEQISGLLAQLGSLAPSECVALEVVWTPATENDRMSTDELEARYAGLTRLGAPAGRVFCSYCGGPHAAELPKCPHCGAASS